VSEQEKYEEPKYEVAQCEDCGRKIPETLIKFRDPWADVQVKCKECYEKCQKNNIQ